MRKVGWIFVLVMVLISSTVVFGYTGAEPFRLPITFLVTVAGQGGGRKMMDAQFLSTKTFKKSVDYISNAEPGRENSFQIDFTDDQGNLVKAVVVVIGSTSKGLGASGITIDDEIARLNKMIEEVKKLRLILIAIHIEGSVRRGDSANERSIDAIAPFADHIIVTKDSNFDGKFTKLATEKGIPITILDNQLEIQKIIRFWYENK